MMVIHRKFPSIETLKFSTIGSSQKPKNAPHFLNPKTLLAFQAVGSEEFCSSGAL